MKNFKTLARIMAIGCYLAAPPLLFAESPAEPQEDEAENPVATADAVAPGSIQEALAQLELTGVSVNIEEWCVDVEASVSLTAGLLELVACIKDSKEHESVVAVNAKPSQIHTALLLLNAKPGSPAMRKMIGAGDDAEWTDIQPRGGLVDVYLVIDMPEGKKEFPINRFIKKASDAYFLGRSVEHPDKKPEFYPTHTFMFTGSLLVEREKNQPRQYVADFSGNVISLVTFGDEMIATPEIHDDSNEALLWEVHGENLPEIGSPVKLRLRPQRTEKPQAQGSTPTE